MCGATELFMVVWDASTGEHVAPEAEVGRVSFCNGCCEDAAGVVVGDTALVIDDVDGIADIGVGVVDAFVSVSGTNIEGVVVITDVDVVFVVGLFLLLGLMWFLIVEVLLSLSWMLLK